MKYLLLLISFFILVEGGAREMEIASALALEDREGIMFKKDQEVPFTGISVKRWKSKKVRETTYLNGMRHGPQTDYFEDNGKRKSLTTFKNDSLDDNRTDIEWGWVGDGEQIIERAPYKNGKRHGLRESWYNNKGHSKLSETRYVNGLLTGKSTRWFANGQIEFEHNWVDDKIVSKKCWHYKGHEINCKK